jgi:hypothetical protein
LERILLIVVVQMFLQSSRGRKVFITVVETTIVRTQARMDAEMSLQLGFTTKRFLAFWERTGQLDPLFLLARVTFNVFKHVVLP